jgi:hypothetical protein
VPAGNIATFGIANNQPVIFTGVDGESNIGIEANTVYYIKNAWNANNNFTISQTRSNGIAGIELQGINTVSNANIDVDFTAFTNGSDIFRRIPLTPF